GQSQSSSPGPGREASDSPGPGLTPTVRFDERVQIHSENGTPDPSRRWEAGDANADGMDLDPPGLDQSQPGAAGTGSTAEQQSLTRTDSLSTQLPPGWYDDIPPWLLGYDDAGAELNPTSAVD